MYFYYFNIAHNGTHLFRTDQYDEPAAKLIEQHLIARFPASAGYSISCNWRPQMYNTREVKN